MIFQHTHQLVMSGAKTQTRRIIKPGQYWNAATGSVVQHYDYRNDVPVYSEEHTYAVQPGRGQKAVGRIEITGIRREDVRQISHEDVLAEGFETYDDFIALWIAMHDKQLNINWPILTDATLKRNLLKENPRPHLYQAWVLEFRLVEGGS